MVKALAEKLAEEDTRGSGPRIWISLGSEAEIVAESVTATRDPILIRATKKRRDFYQKIALADRDSLETWSSSQMECRPFKDPSFDKYMLEQDTASQAIPDTKDTAAQTVQKVHRNNQVQYMPRTMEIPEAKAVLSSNEMGDFLTATKPKYYSF